jgi:hypothetical protein
MDRLRCLKPAGQWRLGWARQRNNSPQRSDRRQRPGMQRDFLRMSGTGHAYNNCTRPVRQSELIAKRKRQQKRP